MLICAIELSNTIIVIIIIIIVVVVVRNMKLQPLDLKRLSVLNADNEGTQPKCVVARKGKTKRLAKETIPERGKVNITVLVSSLKGGHYLYFDHIACQRTSNGYYDFV